MMLARGTLSRKMVIAIALVLMLALAQLLIGCASQDGEKPGYARVCVDEQTHERVDGDRCGSGSSASDGFLFWYLLYGQTLPRYGQPVVGGYDHVPSTAIVQQAERTRPGKSYTKATTRSYSTGSGKKLGTTSGGTGYRAPAPKPAAPAPKPAGPAPKAPAYKAPAPVYKAPAPAYRAPAPIRVGK